MPLNASSSPARLEAFSDGVIAVIITIMVLELKVPARDGVEGLRSIIPTLLVYALSFSVTGIYWINHRHLIDGIEGRLPRIAESILYANLFLLFCLSLLPFFTAYVLAKHLDSFSVALYGASNVITGSSFFILRLAILHSLRRVGRLIPLDTAARPRDIASLTTYLLSIPLALAHPYLSLCLMATVSFMWIFPNTGTRHVEEHAHSGLPTGTPHSPHPPQRS